MCWRGASEFLCLTNQLKTPAAVQRGLCATPDHLYDDARIMRAGCLYNAIHIIAANSPAPGPMQSMRSLGAIWKDGPCVFLQM